MSIAIELADQAKTNERVGSACADDFRIRHEGTLRILHISDLHIQMDTDFDSVRPWPQLRNAVADIRPDLIVATGDIADRPLVEHVKEQGGKFWSRIASLFSGGSPDREWDSGLEDVLSRSREYLYSLCQAAGLQPETRLRVIPGNHDYRVQGLLSRDSSAAATFMKVFSAVGKDMQNNWRDPTGAHAAFRTRIYCLDSNGPDELTNFAAGRVEDVELRRIQPSGQPEDPKMNVAGDEFRIVLMHHHPMPIAELEQEAKTRLTRFAAITEDDRFLMLRNAGTVMQHLANGRVHLILHGHRHCRGYAQVAFPHADQEVIHRMTIVAAGSVGTGSHHFSVIDVRPPGGIEVAEWKLEAMVFRRQAQRTLVEVDAGRTERSRQALVRNASSAVAFAQSIEDRAEISPSGDARVVRTYRRLRPLADEPLKQIPIGVGSTLGYIHPSQRPKVTLMNVGTGQRAWFTAASDNEVPDPNAAAAAPRITGYVTFEPPIAPGREIDIQVEFLVVNSHETLREFRLANDPKSEGQEHVGYNTRRIPCARLIQIVRRPLELDCAGCEWHSTVLRPDGGKDWDEWNSSSVTAQELPGLGAFLMVVRHPLSGHNYRIGWDLPKLSELEATLEPFQKLEYEQLYDRLSEPGAQAFVERALKSTFNDLAAELLKHLAVTSLESETVMSFMRFDSTMIRLQRITDSSGNRASWDLLPGVAIPGQALRRRRPVLHSTHGGTTEAVYYKRPPYLGRDLRFQLSLPITYPPIRAGGKLYPILGVISLESTAGDRGLLDLISGEAANVALRQVLEQWIAERIVRALAQEANVSIDMSTWK